MSGLMNATPARADAMSDPVLEAAEQKIEAQVSPAIRDNYMKIVVAGMAASLARGPDSILASLRNSDDPVRDAAKGAVAMVLILRREAKGVMPLKAMVPAAMTLMLHALDFVNRTGAVKIDSAALVRATHIFTNDLFGHFGITPAMLAHATAKVHAITQDPAAMLAVNQRAGIVRHPMAADVSQTPGGV